MTSVKLRPVEVAAIVASTDVDEPVVAWTIEEPRSLVLMLPARSRALDLWLDYLGGRPELPVAWLGQVDGVLVTNGVPADDGDDQGDEVEVAT